VPVDVDERFLLIDPAAVEAAVTPRTRAIVPVHLYGQTAPVTELRAIAAAHDLVIVEDAAQAQGASSSAGRAGALGLAAATSFYPSKNLGGAGDGGAVLTDDDEVADLVRTTAAHGSRVRYAHDIIGINSRLDAVQAVVLRAKLRRLEGWNAARRAAAERYRELLADIPGLELPGVRPGNVDACHLYVVRVDERDRVMRALHDEGIGAAVHYPTPLHLTGAYAHLGRGTGAFPVTERAAGRLLSLPMFPHLTLAQQERVAAALARAVR
jgi:dTDP-4-amino-4,6-dideoxygalactose transaminase